MVYDLGLVRLWLTRGALFAAPGLAITLLVPRLAMFTALCLLVAVAVWPFLAVAMPLLERRYGYLVIGAIVFCFMESLLGLLGVYLLFPYLGLQFEGHSTLGAEGPVVLIWWLILLLSLVGAVVGPRLFVSSLAVGAFAPKRPRSLSAILLGWLLAFTILSSPVLILLAIERDAFPPP